jgi:hypothetical protein
VSAHPVDNVLHQSLYGPEDIFYQLENSGDLIFTDLRFNEKKRIVDKSDIPPGSLTADRVNCANCRVWNSLESDKIIWLTGDYSVSLTRLKDFKKKVYRSFWILNSNEDEHSSLTPIGLEYVDDCKSIVGLARMMARAYYWIILDTRTKQKSTYPTILIDPRGRLGFLQRNTGCASR